MKSVARKRMFVWGGIALVLLVLLAVAVAPRPVPAGEPLLELADPADLEIVADYLSTDAVRIHPGMAAQIEQWGGGTLRGHVRRVEPYGFLKVSALGVEEQRVNVIIDFDDPRGPGSRSATAIVSRSKRSSGSAPAW